MGAAEFIVRATSAADRDAWFELWTAYCAFYETVVAPGVSGSTWDRIISGTSPVHGLVAARVSSGAVVGFANYVVHPQTWSERDVCYLEDLFVRAESRGCGVGRALIERLIELGARNDWSRVYWMTQERNAPARRLYDRFVGRDDFIRYTITLDDPSAGLGR